MADFRPSWHSSVLFIAFLSILPLSFGLSSSLIQNDPSGNLTISQNQTLMVLEHPLLSSSVVKWSEERSEFRFRIRNPYNTSTLPFRFSLASDFPWFDPASLEFALPPDGYLSYGEEPYWDVPPISPNESVEISFVVHGRVGLADSISVRAEPINRWPSTCSLLAPIANTSLPDVSWLNVTPYYSKPVGDQIAYLVFLDNYDSFAILSGSGQYPSTSYSGGSNRTPPSFSISTNETLIRSVISSYISSVADRIPPSDQIREGILSKPRQLLMQTYDSKKSMESECMRISGMERYPCTSRQSCMYACFSIQVCSSLGQSGWDFIDTLRDYNQTRTRANDLLSSAINYSDAFASTPSYHSARTALDRLNDLNRAETAVIYHPLMTTYGFCGVPDYSLPLQMAAKRQLLDFLNYYCIYGEEERLVNESLVAGSKLKQIFPESDIQTRNGSLASSTTSSDPSSQTPPPSLTPGSQQNNSLENVFEPTGNTQPSPLCPLPTFILLGLAILINPARYVC